MQCNSMKPSASYPLVSDTARERLMKREMTELPQDLQTQISALESLPEDKIDASDGAEFLDWSDARRGVFYRPVNDTNSEHTQRTSRPD